MVPATSRASREQLAFDLDSVRHYFFEILEFSNVVCLYKYCIFILEGRSLPEGFEAGDSGCLSGRKTLAGLWPS